MHFPSSTAPVQAVDEAEGPRQPPQQHDIRHLRLKVVLLLFWAGVSFGACYYARELQAFTLGHWPLGYWVASQGALLVFFLIVLVYALVMARLERQDAQAQSAPQALHSPQEYG